VSEIGTEDRSDDQTEGRRGRGRGTRRPRTPAGPPADPVSAAREIVLRQLTDGPRTRAQLAAVLTRKFIPDDVIASVLDRFEDVDLIDDEEFARQWVESRHTGRGLARRALGYELRKRGVADDTVKEALEQVSPDDELAAARDLVRRKLRSMSGAVAEDHDRATRRLAGMLARKGYGPGVAWQAIREELAVDEEALGASIGALGDDDPL
jgi:regulatory protein